MTTTALTGAAGITAAAGVTEGYAHDACFGGCPPARFRFCCAVAFHSRRTARGAAAAAATRGHARGWMHGAWLQEL